jgi:hypothetical protein
VQQGLELTPPPFQASSSTIHNTWKRRMKIGLLYLLFLNVFGTLYIGPMLEEEAKELKKRIEELEAILKSEKKVLEIIKQNKSMLKALKEYNRY